jgi:hypothetical protein
LHKTFIKEKLKESYQYLLINNDGHSPSPKEGYSDSIFSSTSTPILPQPLHELKPFSRKKPKIKYETLDNAVSEIRMFTGIRSPIEIHHGDSK